MFSVYLLRVHNTVKQEAGGGGGRGVTVLVQGKVVILDARANDARNMRSRVAHCKTRESP